MTKFNTTNNRRKFNKNKNNTKNSQGNKKNVSKAKTIKDVVFNVYDGSTFESDIKVVRDHISGTFKNGMDVEKALKDGKPNDLLHCKPSRQVNTDANIQKENDEIYRVEVTEWIKRRHLYDQNMSRAQKTIWGLCTTVLQRKLESRKEYADSLSEDPLALVEAMRDECLGIMSTKYRMFVTVKAIRGLVNIRQSNDDNEYAHKERMNAAYDIFEL